MNLRKIIHVDMDAFFASVEQLDRPELRGLPIAVGGAEARGVVATASYEARRFGVRSAMPGTTARRLCPSLVFVTPRFDRYKEVSAMIHSIFRRYTSIIEPLSIDEAFLDVSDSTPTLAVDIARAIKADILAETGLTASAGVSYNKFLAKIASDWRKPNGLCTIHPDRAAAFIAALPIEKFWGVGPVTARKMHSLGIHTGADLSLWTEAQLTQAFGKAGAMYYGFARGIDNRPVETHRERKSLSCETTLPADIMTLSALKSQLVDIAAELSQRIARKHFSGSSLTLKIKFNDFSTITRSHSLPCGNDAETYSAESLYAGALPLLDNLPSPLPPIRLIGLGISRHSATEPAEQPTPFKDAPLEVWRQLTFPF